MTLRIEEEIFVRWLRLLLFFYVACSNGSVSNHHWSFRFIHITSVVTLSEEQGVQHASYALKLLQSEGAVTIASTGKDDSSGNLVTKTYTVEGPVMLMLTTTAIDIDEELLNRCLVLTVNESRDQTRAIHQAQRQRRTLQGLERQLDKDAVIARHRHAQQLLRPLAVVNPFAERLRFVDDQTRTRRDHEKYLTLIDSIALLHQHPVKTLRRGEQTIDYVEVTVEDIAAANRLAHQVLGKTLDELPAQTRKLLVLIQAWVAERCQAEPSAVNDFRFSRRQIRQATGWGNTQLKVHLQRLVEMEYLLVHRGGRGQSFEYELLYDRRDDPQPHLMGLIEVAALPTATESPPRRAYDADRSGQNTPRSGSGRAAVGGWSEGENPAKPRHSAAGEPSGRGGANGMALGV